MKIKLISTCCGGSKEYEVNSWDDYMAAYLKLLFPLKRKQMTGNFDKDMRVLIKAYNDTYGHKRKIEEVK